ncbi:MAG: hypothetical protein LBF39_03505 [Prevotellaceae bacterium]|jgi:uncharacterized protein (TIGR02145 family)|nr:hypothetical protein [Prevotellaceae bacterium]
MKKILLSFLSLMGLGFPAFAQSHINIELLGVTYTTPAVQFCVSWSSIPVVTGQTHNSKIWLWVDFIKIENNQPSGTWTRATVANPSPGTVVPETDKGFWLQGATSGSYAATVTVALTNIPANTTFNWCAYASDCPPNASANNGTYTFKGTPPFTLTASDGITTQTVSGTTLTASALTITPTTIRDKTECPGIICPYPGDDLYVDATHLCQQRTSGAQNWEAWIKDTRDNELYRIVLMPDNKWWLAQSVKYSGSGYQPSWCGKDECGRVYSPAEMRNGQSSTGNIQGICPSGWLVPIVADWNALVTALVSEGETARVLGYIGHPCWNEDTYGWADIKNVYSGTGGVSEAKGDQFRISSKMANDATYACRGFCVQCQLSNHSQINSNADCSNAAPIRCFRLL